MVGLLHSSIFSHFSRHKLQHGVSRMFNSEVGTIISVKGQLMDLELLKA